MIEVLKAFLVASPWLSLPVVFGVGLVSDFVWARTVGSVGQKRKLAAANWCLVQNVCGLWFTLSITESSTMGVFAFLMGAWIGIFVALSWE